MSNERSRAEIYQHYTAWLAERFFQHHLLAELQDIPQWGVWKGELEGGKRKKIPYNPNHRSVRASVKILKSWGTLDQALTALSSGEYSGLGFLITPPLAMLDIDNSFDRQSGTVTSELATTVINELPTYYEASPYKGVHGLVFVDRPIRNIHTAELEIYGHDRFTTITTDHIDGTPTDIRYHTDAIEALIDRYAPVSHPEPAQNTGGGARGSALTELPPEAAGDEVLQALLRGDMSMVGNDHHRADWLLLMKLLHWTGDNAHLAKAIFLASPLGQRDKAQDETGRGRRGNTNYVDRTIARIRERRYNAPMKR